MANRINLGESYENDQGEERYRYWIDVSNALMNELTAKAMETGEAPREMLAQAIEGDLDLGTGDSPATAQAED